MSNDRILSQILGSGAASGFAGGLAGGLASGLLTSKAGRKLGKKALRVGGVAAVGGLAYAAWSRYRQGQAGSPSLARTAGADVTTHGSPAAGGVPGSEVGTPRPEFAAGAAELERFVPAAGQEAAGEAVGLTLLRAMIAAAQADGKLDGEERREIFERLSTLDLSASEKAALFEQLERPVDLNALVSAATTPEIAAEIYTASLLAIDVDTPAERGYLSMLAARLALPDALVESIHHEVEGGPASVRADAPAEAS